MKIYKNAWFERFAKREKITNKMLIKAIEQAEKGLIDADLGQGVIKQRVARMGQGKSGGYRTIILYLKQESAFFVYGFAKNDRENIRSDETQAFKMMADKVLALDDNQIQQLLAINQFFEVK